MLLYTTNSPAPISTHTCKNIVTMELMLVQTTSCVASCSSLPMEPAMTALDTATGTHRFFTNETEFNNFVATQDYS